MSQRGPWHDLGACNILERVFCTGALWLARPGSLLMGHLFTKSDPSRHQ
jgi:hypothetical protein